MPVSKRLDLSQKVEIIKAVESGTSKLELAKKYGVTQPAIHYTWTQRHVILAKFEEEEEVITTKRKAAWKKLEKAVIEWYKNKKTLKGTIPISTEDVQSKAIQLAKDMSFSQKERAFVKKEAEGWFEKWEREYGVEDEEGGKEDVEADEEKEDTERMNEQPQEEEEAVEDDEEEEDEEVNNDIEMEEDVEVDEEKQEAEKMEDESEEEEAVEVDEDEDKEEEKEVDEDDEMAGVGETPEVRKIDEEREEEAFEQDEDEDKEEEVGDVEETQEAEQMNEEDKEVAAEETEEEAVEEDENEEEVEGNEEEGNEVDKNEGDEEPEGEDEKGRDEDEAEEEEKEETEDVEEEEKAEDVADENVEVEEREEAATAPVLANATNMSFKQKIKFIDQAVFDWFQKEKVNNPNISKLDIQEKAREVARILDISPKFFNGGDTWLKRWTTEYNVEYSLMSWSDMIRFVDEKVFEWYEQTRERNVPINKLHIKTKAQEIAMGAGIPRSVCSGGDQWYNRWRQQYEVEMASRTGGGEPPNSGEDLQEPEPGPSTSTASTSTDHSYIPDPSAKTYRNAKGEKRYDHRDNIEMLLDRRVVNDEVWYLAKYKDYADEYNMWEKGDTLDQKLIDAYEEDLLRREEAIEKLEELLELDPNLTVESYSSYFRGFQLERVVGLMKMPKFFIVKFKDLPEYELVSVEKVKKENPQEFITYFENRLFYEGGREGGQFVGKGLDMVE